MTIYLYFSDSFYLLNYCAPVARNRFKRNMDSDSIYHCYLCNSLLNGKAKILNCLHVICSKCEERKQINISKFILTVPTFLILVGQQYHFWLYAIIPQH